MVSMFLPNILALAALAVINIHASPVQEFSSRNLAPAQCSQVVTIVDVLKAQKATPFCSSFLSINPATATSTVRVTSTDHNDHRNHHVGNGLDLHCVQARQPSAQNP
ncbi:MAG: hypothetical protein Q9197_002238 [Variospora fuerteventurae]